LRQLLGYLLLKALRFGAKWSVFWCKMHCNMPLNAMRFAAKREVKWCKTQYNVPLNARQKA